MVALPLGVLEDALVSEGSSDIIPSYLFSIGAWKMLENVKVAMTLWDAGLRKWENE